MDRWAEMETFIRIVEAGGIGAAAERMGVAKSAVSRRLKELETRLNVRLLNRTTRRLSLTDTGRAYLERCQQIMSDLDEADDAASQTHGTIAGKLRIAAPLSFGVKHLSPAVASFLNMHPSVSVELELNDRRVDLVEDGFDMAVRIGILEDSSLIARKLTDARMIVCASPDFIARHGPLQTPEDVEGLSGLRYSIWTSRRAWHVHDAKGQEIKLSVVERLACNNGDFLIASAEAGVGIAIEPDFLVGDSLRSGKLVPILRDYTVREASIYAIYPPGRHLSARVRAFIDHLATTFGNPPYWVKGLPE